MRAVRLSSLRFVASVGEPLNPEAVVWGKQVLNLDIHDNWWQTETGAIMIANYASMDIRPGSMGRPLPGIEAAIVRRLGEDQVEVISEPDVEGELALKPGWPSMFRGYLHDEERFRKRFAGGWYITGDWPSGMPMVISGSSARRRHHQDRGAYGRAFRSRERPFGASRSSRGGRNRQARSGHR
jgi:acyl-coenzyme A synthetase/AMP-(fatty) acid ligase